MTPTIERIMTFIAKREERRLLSGLLNDWGFAGYPGRH